MSFVPRYEIHDHKGNAIGKRYSDEVAAYIAAAAASREINQGYMTLWWINDWGCPADLLGHAARGTFNIRPCRR
jgi:hypothetical protein